MPPVRLLQQRSRKFRNLRRVYGEDVEGYSDGSKPSLVEQHGFACEQLCQLGFHQLELTNLPGASRADRTTAWVAMGDNSLAQSPFVLVVQLALAVVDKLVVLNCIVEAAVRHNVSSSATIGRREE